MLRKLSLHKVKIMIDFYRGGIMSDYRSELIIALTCAVGTDILPVREAIIEELEKYKYDCHIVKISSALLEPLDSSIKKMDNYGRANRLMDLGNEMRQKSGDSAILAKGAIHQISLQRDNTAEPKQATAYIIDSLKNPEEVKMLREIYSTGFYLFAINEAERFRIDNLLETKNMGRDDARDLVERDLDEGSSYGQNTRGVFELADFHLSLNNWEKPYKDHSPPLNEHKCKREVKKLVVKKQLERIIRLMFSHPFTTPTFDEYAMFMAYSSGLRSADLSRQIGAVIATPSNEIVATGANDCPRFGGGQYWPIYDETTFSYVDEEHGRDYMRGYDSNKREHQRIVNEIVDLFSFDNSEAGENDKLRTWNGIYQSRIKYLTEYGRPVHAEMAAILSCARTGISLQGATLYCSTFPCHNCAKHIIGSGITRVVYIEPYPKSKSVELYQDSLFLADTPIDDDKQKRVRFEEFVGIGPRRFYDLFSMKLSSGAQIKRKQKDGNIVDWDCQNAELRCIMAPSSYFEREQFAINDYFLYLYRMENR